jgi:hypothetical protein
MNLEITVNANGTAYTEKCRQVVGFKELTTYCDGVPPVRLSLAYYHGKTKVTHSQYRIVFGTRHGPKIEKVEFPNDDPEQPTPSPYLELIRALHDALCEYDEHGIATGYLKHLQKARELLELTALPERE